VEAVPSARPLAPSRGGVALVNAFATGGTNYSIVVGGPINIQG
jgi:hypothetical protein